MHIFLFGKTESGKSALIDKIIEQAPGEVCGFRTFFDGNRRLDTKTLYICAANAGAERRIAAQIADGQVAANTGVFETCAVSWLGQTSSSACLRVMDECGFIETEAIRFQQRVVACLDEDIPILGVLQHKQIPWIRAIELHPKVTLAELTVRNRDRMFQELLRHYRGVWAARLEENGRALMPEPFIR